MQKAKAKKARKPRDDSGMNHWKKQRRFWSGRLDVVAYTVLLFSLFMHARDYKITVRNKQEIQKYEKVVKVSLPNEQKVETIGVDALTSLFTFIVLLYFLHSKSVLGRSTLKIVSQDLGASLRPRRELWFKHFSQTQLTRFLLPLRR